MIEIKMTIVVMEINGFFSLYPFPFYENFNSSCVSFKLVTLTFKRYKRLNK